MKQYFLLILVSLSVSTSIFSADIDWSSQFDNFSTIVSAPSDESVKKRIIALLRAKHDTEKLLGRTAIYFSYFDQILHELNLPTDLKYIACLESELMTESSSSAGAIGVWQLMADVKAEFGLRIDGDLDERHDKIRGTEAALKDMKRMFENFNSWDLVLAGYNCGAGKLGAAMKKAHSKEFSKIKKFLPNETQQYLSKFIAFSFVLKNYRQLGLTPELPSLDAQSLIHTKISHTMSFAKLSEITGISKSDLKIFNPQFGKSFIPYCATGCNVYLPRRVMSAFNEYVSAVKDSSDSDFKTSPQVIDEKLPQIEGNPNYFKTTYIVSEGETLEGLAQILDVNKYSVILWNNLHDESLQIGTELTIYLPRIIVKRTQFLLPISNVTAIPNAAPEIK